MSERRRIDFDPELQLSPYALKRRLDAGEPLFLVDLRPEPAPSADLTAVLGELVPWPGPDWRPPPDADAVVLDADGHGALELVRRLRRAGAARVWALYGGLELYDFAVEPVLW